MDYSCGVLQALGARHKQVLLDEQLRQDVLTVAPKRRNKNVDAATTCRGGNGYRRKKVEKSKGHKKSRASQPGTARSANELVEQRELPTTRRSTKNTKKAECRLLESAAESKGCSL